MGQNSDDTDTGQKQANYETNSAELGSDNIWLGQAVIMDFWLEQLWIIFVSNLPVCCPKGQWSSYNNICDSGQWHWYKTSVKLEQDQSDNWRDRTACGCPARQLSDWPAQLTEFWPSQLPGTYVILLIVWDVWPQFGGFSLSVCNILGNSQCPSNMWSHI